MRALTLQDFILLKIPSKIAEVNNVQVFPCHVIEIVLMD